MSGDSQSKPSKRRFVVACALFAVFALSFLLALVQGQAGWPFSKTVSLKKQIATAKPAGEMALRVRVPKAVRNALTDIRGVVLEDGIPLPHAVKANRIVEKYGLGRYRVKDGYIRLSSTDGSDPRTNGRTYELRAPRVMKPALFWGPLAGAVTALFLLLRIPRPPTPRLPSVAMEHIAALALALGVMLFWLAHHSHLSDGWLVVDGVPASDARGWLELSESLAEGRGFNGGFESHRGGYAIILSAVFSLTGGASILTAKLVNVVLLSLGAGLAFAVARSAFGALVAWVLLFALLLSDIYGSLAQYTLTEPVGFAIGMIGLHQLYLAAIRNRPLHFALAGVFLALSNITRPFTLLALPLFGLVLLVLAIRGRWGLKPFLLRTALYVGGALLVFGPWVIRQKLAWDVATLDLNSAVMLYGAAQIPPEGSDGKRYLDARHYKEGKDAGIAPDDRTANYHFFMRRYRESVARDPAEYFAYLRQCFVRFFEAPGASHPDVRAAYGAAFFLCLLWLSATLRCAPLLLLAALWPPISTLLDHVPTALVLAISACFAAAGHGLRARIAVALLAASLIGAGTLNAMVGNFALDRGTVFVDWITVLLGCAGIAGLARLVARVAKGPVEATDEAADPEPQALAKVVPIALGVVLAAGFCLVLVKNAVSERPDPALWELSQEDRERLLAFEREDPAVANVPEDALMTAVIEFGMFRYYAPAGRDLGYYSRDMEVREQEHTVLAPTVGYREDGGRNSMVLNIPGDARGPEFPRSERYALVGLRNIGPDRFLGINTEVIDALLIAPIDPQTGSPDLDAARRFTIPPDWHGNDTPLP